MPFPLTEPDTGFDLSIWQLLTLLLIGSGLVVGGSALLYRSRRGPAE